MRTTPSSTTAIGMRYTRAILCAFALAAITTVAHAQTSVPTPQSVAPAYKPPQTTTATGAQQYHYVAPHAGTWDFYLTAGMWIFNDSSIRDSHVRIGHNDYASGLIRMNFDDAFAFGFGAGYNITEQLSVHGQFAYANPDYNATFTDDMGGKYNAWGSADVSTGDFAVRYDFLQGKLRPFVQGSVGFMYLDTGIPNGPNAYWWDYYWGGYYVDTPTVSHTYLTLGATAGLRYEFSTHVFGQLSYTANWADTPHSWLLNQRINLSIGWNY